MNDKESIKDFVDTELTRYYKTKLNQNISDLVGDLKVVQKNNVSKSFFDYGFTIFKENHNIINRINSNKMEKGGKLDISLTFNNTKYSAELRNINRDVNGDTYQIRYDSQEDLKKNISKYLINADSLIKSDIDIPKIDLMLTNPPFGIKKKHKDVFEKNRQIFARDRREYRTPKELMKSFLSDKYINERVKKIILL